MSGALSPDALLALQASLCAEGAPVSLDAVVRAQKLLAMGRGWPLTRLRAALRATLVHRREHLDAFDRAFEAVAPTQEEAVTETRDELAQGGMDEPRGLALGRDLRHGWWRLVAFVLLVLRSLARRRTKRVTGPWEFRVKARADEEVPWFTRDEVHRVAATLVRAIGRRDPSSLAVEASVRATARRGGFPTLVRGTSLATPDVAVVIEYTPRSARWAAPFEELVRRLQTSGSRVRPFWFGGDPTRATADRKLRGKVAWAWLRESFDAVIFVGEATEAVDDFTGEPFAWVRALGSLPRVLWLHPLPRSRWSAGVGAVASSVTTLPATLRSLDALDGERRPWPEADARPWFSFIERGAHEEVGFEALREYLGAAFAWLAYAAVAQTPDVVVAEQVARRLGRRLGWNDRLRLATLPWFAQREWPEALRRRLLDALPEEERVRAFAAWREVLDEAAQDAKALPDGSVARLEWRVAKVVRAKETDAVVEESELAELRASPVGRSMDAALARAYARSVVGRPWVEMGEDRYGRYAVFVVGGVTHRMRWIPPGRFVMGSPESEEGRWEDEGPQYKVTLTEGYWLGETPVTQALWVVVMGANPSWFKGSERPVEMVSWEDCQEFLRKLNGMVEGLNVRLPTEAEWERACRAGTSTATWLGSNSVSMLDRIAWYSANSDGQTHAVRGKEPNPYGLHDMLGDVWEWCRDWYSGDAVDAERDPTGPVTGTLRVVRGASWSSPASRVRAGQRDAFSPAIHVYDLGFRLAQDQAEAS